MDVATMSRVSLKDSRSKSRTALDVSSADFLVGGRFLDINQDGKAAGKVWLGLTKDEFVRTELTMNRERQPGTKHDLSHRTIVPLKLIRIFVVDDRAKRVAVSTSEGDVAFYEMCKPKDSWPRWKRAAAKLEEKHNARRQRKKQTSSELSSLYEGNFITYPFICRQISERAVQTDPLPTPKEPEVSSPKVDNSPVTYLDELDPIVVQEYQVAMDRVSFYYDDEMIHLCKIRRHPVCFKSNSTTCVRNQRNSGVIILRSSSCPNLWNPPESIERNQRKPPKQHFARRKLNTNESDIVEEILLYRRKQQCYPRVYGEWNTKYTWNWDDSFNQTVKGIDNLLEEARGDLGLKDQKGPQTPIDGGQTTEGQDQTKFGTFDFYEYMSNSDMRDFHAGEIAMQMTLRDRNLIWLLRQDNITKLALSPLPESVRATHCINLIKMAAWSKRITRLVATEVLDQPNYESCSETIKLFIKVAEFCWLIRNFNSFVNVMRGLQFYPVYRLGVVWEYLYRTDPTLCQLYLTMCDRLTAIVTELYTSGKITAQVSSKHASIPWFPAAVCRLVSEAVHQQFIRHRFKRQSRAVSFSESVDLSDLEVVIMRDVASQTGVPPWLNRYAQALSADILERALNDSVWQIFDSGSSSSEGPDSSVDERDELALDSLNLPKDTDLPPETPQKPKRRKSVVDDIKNTTRNLLLYDSEHGTILEKPHEAISEDENRGKRPLMERIRIRAADYFKDASDEEQAQATRSAKPDDDKRNNTLFETVKARALKLIEDESGDEIDGNISNSQDTERSLVKDKKGEDDDEKPAEPTVLGKVIQITKKAAEPVTKQVSALRGVTDEEDKNQSESKTETEQMIEKLSEKAKMNRRKSTVETVKDYMTGQEEEKPKPYIHPVVDKDLTALQTQLNREEAAQPKDTVHIIANKKRTPKVIRFFGKFFRSSKSTKSVGGVPYEPTGKELAALSFPNEDSLRRAKFRYAEDSKHQVKHMKQQTSLLSSSTRFAGVNKQLRGVDKNDNARKRPGIISSVVALAKPRPRPQRCDACFTWRCPFYGEPARYLLELQLAAGRYKYIFNEDADNFLTRRPVLSDYELLESFQEGIL